MDINEAIHTRRSIKSFTPTAVPRQTLLDLVDSARYAPSGGNKNAARFLLVTQREKLEKLGQAHPFCKWLATAPAAIAVVVDSKATRYWLEDTSVAAYALWLAATGKGLGVAWAAMHQSDNPAETEKRQQHVREALSIPQGLQVPMVLAVGYPQAVPGERKKPTLEEIVCWERYPAGSTG
ncbi:MAG: nitroreductase family protein [Chloroflexi bacterium]|nr:nitroreductase family protein [Chloroflexota bacterium]